MENKIEQHPRNARKKKRNSWIKRFILLFWFFLLAGMIAIAGVLYGTSIGMLGPLPDVAALENPEINIASEIYSAEGLLIDRFEKEKRIPITYNDLPTHMIEALYAREDVRFDDHSGVDGEALMRAVLKGGKEGGGSTITQQLAKQLFTKQRSPNKIEAVKQKLKEWVVAIQLEKRYTKDEIVTMYLNKFDFIYRANGVEAAAKTYFQKEVKDLNLAESATLISMLKNPVLYNPKDQPARSQHERNVVLAQMLKYNYISQAEFDAIKDKPIVLNFKMLESTVDEGISAYFKHALRMELENYFTDYEKKYGVRYDVYRDGLKIYTTIDSRMQKMAEEAIKLHLTDLQKLFFSTQKGRDLAPFYNITKAKADEIFQQAMRRTQMYKDMKNNGISEEDILAEFNRPRDSVQFFTWDGKEYRKDQSWMDSIRYHKHIIQAGLMSMDPHDGTIKAWVGGVDWNYFKFDHVKQARRQVGSTIKPLIYATAIHQMNYSPCHQISNMPIVMGNWKPGNAGYPYTSAISLRDALAKSVNMPSVRLILESTPKTVIQLAKDLGINSPLQDDPTIALGSSDITLYEMVGAYSTFANQGIYIKPELIITVEDKNGKIIKDYEPITREVFNREVAYTMVDLMKGVIDIGTGRSVRGYNVTGEVGGKTGTTNEGSDSWFIGMVPNLVTGVWVGNEDRAAHFNTWQSQGAKMALPIWGHYMKAIYANSSISNIEQDDKFEKPEGIEDRWDCSNNSGFYDFGNVGVYDERPRPTQQQTQSSGTRERSVNELITSDLDTVRFD